MLDGTDLADSMETETLLSKCVSVDLEVDPNSGRIQSFAAIRSATADTCTYSKSDLATALRALDEYAAGTAFVLGHNIINHDLRYLREACSSLTAAREAPDRYPLAQPVGLSPQSRITAWSSTTKTDGSKPGAPATRNSMPASSSRS